MSPSPRALVRPLEDGWQAILDAVLASLRAPRTSEIARLAPRLAELSRAYNAGLAGDDAGGAGRGRAPLPLDARVAFSFPRDVPKGGAAVREIVASGALALAPDRPLRVLDLGAGLGAMSHGIVRALEASGARGAVEALLVDDDERVLEAARAIAREASTRLGGGAVELVVRTRAGRVDRGTPLPAADLVVLGQVLSELDRSATPADRVARHVDLLRGVADASLAPGGWVVIVEPALRDRTRHLHAVRDALLASGAALDVVAPCLHASPCPALAAAREWCHEDLRVDLPPWVAPLARAAGLRFQGLTFSYLVLQKRAVAPIAQVPAHRVRLRVISERIETKGKSELFGCTAAGERVRFRRLDRDRSEANAAWDDLERGDVVTLTDEDGARIGPQTGVDARAFTNL